MAWFSFTALVDGNVLSAADINTPLTNASGGTVTVAHGGTGLTSGTSGGVPYFSATTTIASSAALTQYGVIYGGGAGASPVATSAGTASQVFVGGSPPAFGTAPVAGGGTNITSYTAGDTLYASGATTLTKLAKGTARQVLRMNSGATAPEWGTSASYVRKSSDETVNGSDTLQNDDALLYALAANEVVAFTASIHHSTNTTADIKFAFTVPAGATLRWGFAFSKDAGDNANFGASTTTSGGSNGLAGTGDERHVFICGTVVNGANAGNLQLQWAQQTSNASDTKVLANSWLRVETIS